MQEWTAISDDKRTPQHFTTNIIRSSYAFENIYTTFPSTFDLVGSMCLLFTMPSDLATIFYMQIKHLMS